MRLGVRKTINGNCNSHNWFIFEWEAIAIIPPYYFIVELTLGIINDFVVF
jgi:hypothetical protein